MRKGEEWHKGNPEGKDGILEMLLEGEDFDEDDEADELFELSFAQERLWFLDQLEPHLSAYNMPAAVKLHGYLNFEAFEDAINEIIERHEALRTNFQIYEDEPVQIIHEFESVSIPFEDLSTSDKKQRDLLLKEKIDYELNCGFDLQTDALIRFKLIKLHENEHILLITMHHIVSDGWSVGVFVNEMVALYTAFVNDQDSPLLDLPIQYADFAIWQRENVTGEVLAQQLQFWKEILQGCPDLLKLPTDRPRPSVQTFNGANYCFKLDLTTLNGVKNFANHHGLTPFMVLLGAYQLLLSRYSRQQDICVGVPVAGRQREELEGLIGFFVNGVVIRGDLSGNPTVLGYMSQVKKTALAAFAHQDAPAEQVIEAIAAERSLSYAPIAQVGFTLQNLPVAAAQLPDLIIEPITLDRVASKYDMTLEITESATGFDCGLEYNTDLFDAATINKMMRHYVNIVMAMLADENQLLNDIDMLDANELIHLLGLQEVEVESLLPLTSTQRDLYLDAVVNPETLRNSLGYVIEIHQKLDEDLWRQAYHQVVKEQSVLRSIVVPSSVTYTEMAYQCVLRHKTLEMEWIDLSQQDPMPDPDVIVKEKIYRTFDIANDDLLKGFVIKLRDDFYLSGGSSHHMIFDGLCGYIHQQQMQRVYQQLFYIKYHSGNAIALTVDASIKQAPDIFKDYVMTERKVFDTPASLQFWQQQLENVEGLDVPLPRKPLSISEREVFEFDGNQVANIRKFCRKKGLTLSIYFKALFVLMLNKYGSPTAPFAIMEVFGGRLKSHRSAFGCYYHQLPLVFNPEHINSKVHCDQFLLLVKNALRSLKEHQYLSFFQQRQLLPEARLQFLYNFYNFPERVDLLGQQEILRQLTPPVPDHQVQFIVQGIEDKLQLNLFYHREQFESLDFLVRIAALSDQMIQGADYLSELEYFTVTERQQLLDYNQTQKTLNEPWKVHLIFEQQAARTPENNAVVMGEACISYRQLNEQANQLAHYLMAHEVGRDVIVGVCLQRSISMMVAILAVLKAGGAYVPLDPNYPKDRLEYLIDDAKPRFVLTDSRLGMQLSIAAQSVFYMNSQWYDLNDYAITNPAPVDQDDHMIYMIYTSGSTGLPKGAGVNHKGFGNLLQWFVHEFEISDRDKSLIVSSFSFDLTQKNLYAVLLVGGCVVLPESSNFDLDHIINALKTHQITLLNCAPSAFCPIIHEVRRQTSPRQFMGSLRYLFFGGEPIQLASLNEWLNQKHCQVQVVNTYGPTECTDVVAYHRVNHQEHLPIPVGRPIDNVELYIIDRELNLQPPGIAGEIAIGSVCVGRGYVNDQAKTAQVFVKNLWTQSQYERLYRTGDIGRYRENGDIEYLGRIDQQVKIRGLRIELGEIESAITELGLIEKTAVLVDDDRLVAYVSTLENLSAEYFKTALANRLPDYMIPAFFVIMAQLPLTPNGKLDRKALPKPEVALAKDDVPPQSKTELILHGLWQQVLGQQQISIHDDFFDIGGQSLLATQLISRVREAFKIELPLKVLFESTTIASLACAIEHAIEIKTQSPDAALPEIKSLADDQVAPLSFAQERLWFLDKLEPNSPVYNIPIALRLQGKLDQNALKQSMIHIVQRHEVLRSCFKTTSEGQPLLEVQEHVNGSLETEDLSTIPEPQRHQKMLDRARQEALKPFDLSKGPLWRTLLLILGEHDFALLLNMHHIISDGWSAGVIVAELTAFYEAACQQRDANISPLTVQYSDYAYWQRQYLQGPVLDKQLAYWENQLRGAPPVLNLPLDHPRPIRQTYMGAHYPIQFSPDLTGVLNDLSRTQGVTLFMTLLAIYQTLLSRYSGQDDISVGIPIAGRHHPKTESLIGFFVNSLVMRVDLSGQLAFDELLQRVKATTLAAYAHQDLPFEQLVDALITERNLSRPPLVQTAFALQNIPEVSLEIEGLRVSTIAPDLHTAKLDLMLVLYEHEGTIQGTWEYNTDLFESATLARMSQHFIRLCQIVCENPAAQLANQSLVTGEQLYTHLGLTQQRIEHIWMLPTSQRDLHLDSLLNPEYYYNSVGIAFTFQQEIDPLIWLKAIHIVTENEPLLRAYLKGVDEAYLESAYWFVRRQYEPPFEWLDLSRSPVAEINIEQLAKQRIHRHYDIESGDLIRHSVIRLPNKRTLVVIAFHHVILDGIGSINLRKRICEVYEALKTGQTAEITSTNFDQYIQENRVGFDRSVVLDYWKKSLTTIEPLDFAAPSIENGEFVKTTYCFDAELYTGIKQFCRKQGTTPVLFFKALYALLLKTYCRAENDFIIFEIIAGRSRHYRDTLGCFYQQVPLMFKQEWLQPDVDFKTYLKEVKNLLKSLQENQNISVMEQSHLVPTGRLSFFFNAYNFLSDIYVQGESPDLSLHIEFPENQVQLILHLHEQSIDMNLHYHTAYFDGNQFVEKMAYLARQCLSFVEQEKTWSLSAFAMVDTIEQQQIIQNGQGLQSPPSTMLVVDAINRQAELTPDHIAIIYGQEQWRYQQLNQQANQWAHVLLANQVTKGSVVGVFCDRSPALIMAILAVLKAGAAYLPIDPAYPEERIHYILTDAKVNLLLTQTHLCHQVQLTNVQQFCLDDETGLSGYPQSNPDVAINASDLAYVIYTSGSTGQPKGAVVKHQGISNLAQWYTREFTMTDVDKTLIISAIGFDLTQKNLYAPLTIGGCIVLPENAYYDPVEIRQLLSQHQITLLNCAPSAFYPLLETMTVDQGNLSTLDSLRYLFLGGEPIVMSRLISWLETEDCQCQVVNTYGPTECTDIATFYKIAHPAAFEKQPVPIGQPNDNVNVVIVDDWRRLAPIGVPGELLIGGAGVGQGYLYNETLTHEQFIVDNITGQNEVTLYRTGDLARMLENGQIEYLGRVDHQVKLRGLRIELGEIEVALRQHDAVIDSSVWVIDDQLVAFLVCSQPIESTHLRLLLSKQLPDYMIPAQYHHLDILPLTPNGKIDRKALLEFHQHHLPDNREMIVPRNDIEQQLLSIWQQVLEISAISIHDNFFELGGHSLLSVRLIAMIQQQFNCEIPLSALMQNGTIESLATIIQEGGAVTNPVLVPMQTDGERPSCYCVHAVGGNVLQLANLASALQPDIPFYGFQSVGLEAEQEPIDNVEAMATHYIKALQSHQKNGPYQLAGYSFGGMVAYEMAKQLQAQQQTVSQLILIDAPAPALIALNQQETILPDHREELVVMLEKVLPFIDKTHLQTLITTPDKDLLAQILNLVKTHAEGIDPAIITRFYQVYHSNVKAMQAYHPQSSLDISVTLLKASEKQPDQYPDLGWEQHVGRAVEVKEIPGNHHSILDQNHLEQWIVVLNTVLA